ncbi:unnamed protein product [Chironomus riparius]|uniref:Ionotropic receptor n=1 Tax=Chironomus riparius TaxID=315576 RepID=A0A9N9S5A3_9DIPT|nr:unnamed protein product [Chironomus riparius]
MLDSIVFVIFSTIYIASAVIFHKSLTADQNLPNSICRITYDVTSSKSDTQDILFGNLDSQTWSSTVNDIVKCIDNGTAVVVADLKTIIKNKNFRKASVIILALNQANESQIIQLVSKHYFSTVWHHMATFICIVPNSSTLSQRKLIFKSFMNLGSLNVAIVYTDTAGDIIYEAIGAKLELIVQKNPKNGLSLFPDKLKDLQGLKVVVTVHEQAPSVMIRSRTVSSPMMYFLDILEQFLHVKFKLHVLHDYSELNVYRKNRKMQLTLNTVIYYETKDPKLFTYEKNGYCALVPVPSKVPLYHLIFIKPFDGAIWILFGVSIIGSVAVWRIYRGRGSVDSHCQLAAGIFMMFIGQCADFSRRNRFILAFLLNIICLSVFLLSNLYEGAITSFMIEPGHENRITTVKDLVASNYEVVNDAFFADSLKDLKEFDKLIPRMKVRTINLQGNFSTEVTTRQYVYIFRCDIADVAMYSRLPNGRLFTDYYYMLPEIMSWNYVELDASFLNPFIERFQTFMDKSFEAGLPHMWKLFIKQFRFELKRIIFHGVDINYA